MTSSVALASAYQLQALLLHGTQSVCVLHPYAAGVLAVKEAGGHQGDLLLVERGDDADTAAAPAVDAAAGGDGTGAGGEGSANKNEEDAPQTCEDKQQQQEEGAGKQQKEREGEQGEQQDQQQAKRQKLGEELAGAAAAEAPEGKVRAAAAQLLTATTVCSLRLL
jgi:hypothetical protein